MPEYAHPYEHLIRRDIAAVHLAYGEATCVQPTAIYEFGRAGDGKWGRDIARPGRSFTVASADQFLSRLSAVWPEGTPWPADIPRPAPAKIEVEWMEFLSKRLAVAASRRERAANG